MGNVDNDKFYFETKNYFTRFVPDQEHLDIINDDDKLNLKVQPISKSVRHALEYFVNDLRHNRDHTIERFLNEQTVGDIFRSIAQLLLSNDDRVSGNSAYILGSAVELEAGLKQFLSIFSNDRTSNTVDVIRVLCYLLKHSDPECILNAAGTLGTICSSKDGRTLILSHTCISQIIVNTSTLLSSTNAWIASNVALVLARLTVEELGCQTILTHSKHKEILNQLMLALNVDEPSRATNAAFAIGRLIEKDEGKRTLVTVCGQYKIFDALLNMLEISEEKGLNKNACYALSCLCTTQYGFQLCLQYLTSFHRILAAVEKILLSTEQENVWFALMCLRTIAQYDAAHEHLCYSQILPLRLKQIRDTWSQSKDIQDEAKILWYMIHRNIKPNQPKLHELQGSSMDISWDLNLNAWNDGEIQYRIILDDVPIAVTNVTTYSLKNLKPNATYSVQIQYITSYGDSVRSDSVIFHTEEDLPPPVNNLHMVRRTMTAVRVAWDPPDLSCCSSFKGYQIYLNNAEHETTVDSGITIGSLTANTTYQVDVYVVSGKGKGPPVSINIHTASAGDSNPAPPTFPIIGRRELHIKWLPPEVIAGRLSRYELYCNGQQIYLGFEQEYHATGLRTDTEYSFEVVVITNEGRFRSRPAKVRTLKDQFGNAHRHSLYESPSQNQAKMRRTETFDSSSLSGTNNQKNSNNINHSPSKVSPKNERRLSREATAPARTAEVTTLHTLQFKPQNLSSNRILPGIVKAAQSRNITTIKTRQNHRSPVNSVSLNQRPPPARISTSIVAPSLTLETDPKMQWVTPVAHRATQPAAYRLSLASKQTTIVNDTKRMDRCVSTSLPDLPIDFTRAKPIIES